MNFDRKDVEFLSSGVVLRAWHYQPHKRAREPNPCVVMAHGLNGTRTASLEPFADTFVGAGLDVLLFDYAHYGDSDGEPRQVFSVSGQLQNWADAIAYARKIDGVDPERIALWGTSMSGGHVIVAGARDGKVAAISAQGPMMDGWLSFMKAMQVNGSTLPEGRSMCLGARN